MYIRTSIEAVKRVLLADTEELLRAMPTPRDPLRGVGLAFTGIMPNPPYAWVMPRNTGFDDETQVETQGDALTVKIGVTGGDAELVAWAAIDYVAAVDQAIRNAVPEELDPTITHLHVRAHDYGPLFEKGGAFARFPELHLEITRREVIA